VRTLPLKDDEPVTDPALNAVFQAGATATLCLVEHLTDTTPMPDPRKAPPSHSFVVGDLASILLCRITGRLFEDQLPPEVRESFQERGVSDYFDYVHISENRIALRRNWEEWLRNRNKK